MVRPHPGALIGRDAELALLDGFVRDVVRGHGRAVWIEGEPGIGKSALLTVALRGVELAGCQVFQSTAHELGQRFPLQVLLECLRVTEDSADPQRADIAATLRGQAPSVAVSDPVTIAAEGILSLIDRLCAAAPVMLVVDDLQWADEASLAVWDRLSRSLDQLPLLLVSASRPPGRRATTAAGLRRSLGARGAEVLSLGPLRASDSTDLVTQLLGAGPGARLRRLADRAGGNPLYLREIVDAMRRDDQMHIVDGVAEITVAGAEAPATLAAAIADRLGFLSPDTTDVLRIAAILGLEFAVTDLTTVTGRPALDLMEVVEEGLATGVLTEVGVRLAFRHALIRQSLAEAIPAGVRTALHLQAARALVAAGASLDRVAEQLLAAANTGALTDGWVFEWLVEAGPRLVYRAPELAAGILERTVDELPGDSPHRFKLSYLHLTAAWLAGRDADVERRARQLLTQTRDAALRTQVSWALAYVLGRTSRYEEAIGVTTEALADPHVDAVWSARLLAIQAIALMTSGRYDEAESVGEAARSVGEQVGDGIACGYALHALSQVRLRNHDAAVAMAYMDRALSLLAEDLDTSDLRLLLMVNRVYALEDADRLDEAVTAAREAARHADHIGSRARRTQMSLVLAEMLFIVGRWDDAIAELEASEARYYAGRILSQGIVALIAAHHNDHDGIERTLRDFADVDFARGEDRMNAQYMVWARALVAERDRNPQRAAETLAEMLGPTWIADSMARRFWVPDLVRLAMAAGDTALAQVGAEAATDGGTADGPPTRIAGEERCRGLLDGDAGILLAAAERYRAVGRPLEHANTLEDAAVTLAQQGKARLARTTLDDALTIYAGLGAEFDTRRAIARTRAHGLHRGQHGPRRRLTAGWDALTPTEIQVAQLVAQGKSNPDIGTAMFLSRRTVQTHVSHILTKLGAKSRVEIATHATRHAADPGQEESQAVAGR